MRKRRTVALPAPDILAKIDCLTVDLNTGKVYSRFLRSRREIGHHTGQGNRVFSDPFIAIGVTVVREHPVYRNRMKRIVRSVRRAYIVWYRATGQWPRTQLDYADGNRCNDAFRNLREGGIV